MALDETLRIFLDRFKLPDFSKLDWTQSADRLRTSFHRASRSVERDVPELADISTMAVDGAEGPLKARLYTPLGAGIGAGPGILFFHGGGFVLGDLDSHDMICRRLAAGSRCRVLSVHYRLAPEHPFPAAHEDALAIWRWATKRTDLLTIDPDRICVAGDSAGGNLAAYLCQELKRAEEPAPAFQLLLYPLVQFADIGTKKLTFQEGFFLSERLFEYFRDAYIQTDTDRMNCKVSPLFAPDNDFRGLPPAHVVLCGWDPLKDEGRAYATKLAAHGVPVTIREHPGMVHGFMNLTAVSVPARDAIHEAGETVGRALGAL